MDKDWFFKLLDMGNGKFLTIIVMILVISVSWYSQGVTIDVNSKMHGVELRYTETNTKLATEIENLKRDQKELDSTNRELRREMDRINMMQQINSNMFEDKQRKDTVEDLIEEYNLIKREEK